MLRNLVSMPRDRDGADVTFVVGRQLFPAHRCELAARLVVFRAELFGPMREKDASRVRNDDMELSIFEARRHFVYTDSLSYDDREGGKNVWMQHLLVGMKTDGKIMFRPVMYFIFIRIVFVYAGKTRMRRKHNGVL